MLRRFSFSSPATIAIFLAAAPLARPLRADETPSSQPLPNLSGAGANAATTAPETLNPPQNAVPQNPAATGAASDPTAVAPPGNGSASTLGAATQNAAPSAATDTANTAATSSTTAPAAGQNTAPDSSPAAPSTNGAAPISGREPASGAGSLYSPNGVISDMERGLSLAKGDVTFAYGDFRVHANQGVIDNNTNTATMSGDLTVTARAPNGTQRTFNGQSLVFDLESGSWKLSNLTATFPPEYFAPGTVLSPLYLLNGTVTGAGDTAGGSDFQFSSCDRDHYHIESKRLDFYRDKRGRPDRIVLRNNSVYVLGKRILPLPVFVILLQGARSRRIGLQPTFGQNSFDGYFAKTVVDLSANSHRTDSLLIDALQKRGLGLGFQRELAQGAGLLYIYALSGKQGGRQIDTRLRRALQITRSLNGFLSFESTKNNSISGEGYATQSGQLDFNFTRERIQSSLLLSQNKSGGNNNDFAQQNATFTHHQDFGSAWNIDINSLYNHSNSTGSDAVATLDNDFALNHSGTRFDAILRTELHDDLTGLNQKNGAYQLERIPELSLSSDSSRLGVPLLDRVLPGQINLALGTFNEPSSLQRKSRTDFNYRANSRLIPIVQRRSLSSQLSIGGGFEQALYSDNTARYNYSTDVNFTTRVGRERVDRERNGYAPLSFQANYLKFAPRGFTPFQFDFQVPNEFVDARAIFQPSSKFRLELASGRDLQNGVSRDITGVLRFAPSRAINMDFSTSYSTEGGGLRDVVGNIYLSRSRERFGGGSILLGLRYSPQESTFTTINAAADLQFGRRTRMQVFAGYNGISKKIDFGQVRVVRDLHCFNLYATYDTSRSQLRFDLALKAFPFLDQRLGQNRFGEGFDPQIGSTR